MNDNIVEVKNISFSYSKHRVLEDISFNIKKGEYLGIIGPNGSGKSTLLKLMLNLIKPSSGEIKVNTKRIGYVSQRAVNIDFAFPATVEEVVSMGRFGKVGLFRNLKKEDKEKVNEALREVEISDIKDRLIGNLSGGQMQRVFIARALASHPEILFLDEPTTGVDEGTQHDFYDLLRSLNKKFNLTLVLVSHDLDTVAHAVSNLICVNQKIVYSGSPKEFMKLHGHT